MHQWCPPRDADHDGGGSIIRRAGALLKPGAGEFPQGFDQKGDVGLQSAKPPGLLQRLLVHVERPVYLDLKALPVHRRTALPLDDLNPLIDLVDTDSVATASQHGGDVVGEFRGASRSVAIAQYKIRAVPAFLPVALRWH